MLNQILYRILYRIKKINLSLIKGNGNKIKNEGKLIGCTIEMFGTNNIVSIGENSIIRNTLFYINGSNINIQIGENVTIKQGEIWAEDKNTEIQISENTTIEKAHIAVTENLSKIIIGRDCMLAKDIEIRTGDSHAIFDQDNNRVNHAQNVIIGDHVWIGSRCLILKGVHIDSNSIIAAGSIVTQNYFKPNIILGGAPAKELKTGISWTRSRN